MRIGNWHSLLAALELIITMPHRHNQVVWGRRTDCGTVRCIAGWIAAMDGWADDRVNSPTNDIYSVSKGALTGIAVERAALISLELDSEQFGVITPLTYGDWACADKADWLSADAEDLASRLFGGGRSLEDILQVVRDYARADGITLPPVIVNEMERLGVPA